MEEDLRWLGISWWGADHEGEDVDVSEDERESGSCRNVQQDDSRDEHTIKRSRLDNKTLFAKLAALIDSRLSRTAIFKDVDVMSYRGVYQQTKRMPLYDAAWLALLRGGYIYPSPHSRKDVLLALSAPNEGDEEVIFPPSLRPEYMSSETHPFSKFPADLLSLTDPRVNKVNWRFRVPDGKRISYMDRNSGMKVDFVSNTQYVANSDIHKSACLSIDRVL
jgi:glutamyl/glutaminyl-tRNA synthetase